MRKTRVRKRTNKKRVYQRSTRRIRSVKRATGGAVDDVVVTGTLGVMNESDYAQTEKNLDQQGAE
jgi:hypothetical protein